MVGQVHLQRCAGGVTLQRGVEVGALGVVLGLAGTADPVHGVAARVGLRDHLLGRMATAQTRDLEAPDVGQWAVGDVHVEQPGFDGSPVLQRWQQLRHEARRHPARVLQVSPALFGLRKRDGRNTKEVTLHGGAHGT
ncbi:hypothetical protein FQZ97_1139700 [compost metagenome]